MAEEDDWKPNGRPQSTFARSFSAALNEAFMIDNSLDGLSQAVEQKKKAVSSQSQELEALEARLRETEERLKQRRSRNSSPSSPGDGMNTAHRRPPVGRTFSGQGGETVQAVATSPLATQPPFTQSRPPTAQSPSYSVPRIPGAMPQTPAENGSSDYVMVDRNDGTQRYENANSTRFNGRKSENIAPHPTRRAPLKPIE